MYETVQDPGLQKEKRVTALLEPKDDVDENQDHVIFEHTQKPVEEDTRIALIKEADTSIISVSKEDNQEDKTSINIPEEMSKSTPPIGGSTKYKFVSRLVEGSLEYMAQ